MTINLLSLSLTIFLISAFNLATNAAAAAYNPTEMILLDCGATSNTKSSDGRSWDADVRSSKYSSNFNKNTVFPSTIASTPILPPIPYTSALIIHSEFTFSFPLSPGSKFLRLHFYPEKYNTSDSATSFFSVTANGQTLMKNFSAYLTTHAEKSPLIKEFIVTVWDNQVLNLTFTPSPNSFAFINGVEIVSMPSGLYVGGSKEIPFVTSFVGNSFPLDNTTTLETIYRLDVGENKTDYGDDNGMYRTWRRDIDFIETYSIRPIVNTTLFQFTNKTTAYTAPAKVYTSLRMMLRDAEFNLKTNLSWKFPVDAGFNYFVRLHFCEFLIDVTGEFQHLFNIFINNQTAEEEVDVFREAGGLGYPIYKDYVVLADSGDQGKELLLQLQPVETMLVDAFLNGLEIFKLNRSDGSLAGPNPDPPISPPEGSRRMKPALICSIIGAIVGGFALFLLVLITFFIRRRKRNLKNSASFASKQSTTKTSSTLPSDLGRHPVAEPGIS